MQNYRDEDTEYYSSAKEFLTEDDRIETDLKLDTLKKKVRVRALSLDQMARINQKSYDDKGVLIEDEYVIHTLLEGVIIPKFTITHIEQLKEKNGYSLQQLADEIWQLGRINKNVFDEYIDSIKALEDVKAEEKKQK